MASVAVESPERTPSGFRDRAEAGRYLARRLSDLAGRADLLVLGIPRGGVPVAYEVAKALHAPLDVIVVRKLGFPGSEELAMGAIASGGIRVLNTKVLAELPVPQRTIDQVAARELKELERRERVYRGDRPPVDPRGRTVVVVDDGLATGSTMRAAVTALRQRQPAEIVVAVPVGATSTCRSLARIADRLVCVTMSEAFFAVGVWYEDFSQTTDEEVRRLLDELAPDGQPALPKAATKLGPDFFIEDSGKTTTALLEPDYEQPASVQVRPGDRIVLSIEEGKLACRTALGKRLGTLEPRLAARLVRLMQRGNSYEAGALSSSRGRIAVLIRQARQAPDLRGVPSFLPPTRLHDIDHGPYEKRELGIEATDLEGYQEPYEEYEEGPAPRAPAIVSKEDLLSDETAEEQAAEADGLADEEEQAARDHELVAEEEDLESKT